jgi:hypothetical protein
LAGQVLLGAETEDRERARALGIVDELTEPGELSRGRSRWPLSWPPGAAAVFEALDT